MPYFTRIMIYCFLHSGPFALIVPLFAFFTFFVGFSTLESTRMLAQLESDGVTTLGEVSALREMSLGDMENTGGRILVTCRFRVGDAGAEDLVEYESKAADGRGHSLRIGDAVAVRYSRSDPAVWDMPKGLHAADCRFGMWVCFIVGSLSAIAYISALVAEPYLRRRWPELAPV